MVSFGIHTQVIPLTQLKPARLTQDMVRSTSCSASSRPCGPSWTLGCRDLSRTSPASLALRLSCWAPPSASKRAPCTPGGQVWASEPWDGLCPPRKVSSGPVQMPACLSGGSPWLPGGLGAARWQLWAAPSSAQQKLRARQWPWGKWEPGGSERQGRLRGPGVWLRLGASARKWKVLRSQAGGLVKGPHAMITAAKG